MLDAVGQYLVGQALSGDVRLLSGGVEIDSAGSRSAKFELGTPVDLAYGPAPGPWMVTGAAIYHNNARALTHVLEEPIQVYPGESFVLTLSLLANSAE